VPKAIEPARESSAHVRLYPAPDILHDSAHHSPGRIENRAFELTAQCEKYAKKFGIRFKALKCLGVGNELR